MLMEAIFLCSVWQATCVIAFQSFLYVFLEKCAFCGAYDEGLLASPKFFFTRIHNYTSSVDLPILVSPTEVDLYSFSKPNVDNNRRARNKK